MQVHLEELHAVLLRGASEEFVTLKMSASLERTTDCPLPLPGDTSSPDEEKDNLTASSELHWEDGGLPGELQRGMETLRVNRELTDVVLSVQGHDFPCHRAILAAASHYFR